MMTRPFLPLAAALMAGISCGNLFRISDLPVWLSLLIALTLILLSRVWIKRRQIHFFFLLLLSIFLLGILAMNLYLDPPIAENHILRFAGDKKLSVEGIICENPQVSPEKTELVVSVSRILRDGSYLPVSGRVLLNVDRKSTRLNSSHRNTSRMPSSA